MIKALGPLQQEIQVHLKYERLPNFCYHCGLLGHLVKDCRECFNVDNLTGEVNEEMLHYGDWLRGYFNAQPPKYVNGSLQAVRVFSQHRQSTFSPDQTPATATSLNSPAEQNEGDKGILGNSSYRRLSDVEPLIQSTRTAGVTYENPGVMVRDKGQAVVIDSGEISSEIETDILNQDKIKIT